MDPVVNTPDNSEVVVKPSEVVEKKAVNNRGLFITVIILLVISIGLGGFYIYNEFFNNAEPAEEVIVVNETEDVEEEEEENTEEIAEESNVYVMKNEEWGLYSMPEYGFSVELSPYTMSERIDPYVVNWDWSVRLEYAQDFLARVHIDFYPDSTNAFACGGGCASEHLINLTVFRNSASKDLAQASEDYFDEIRAEDQEFKNYKEIVSSNEKKWGVDVVKFSHATPSDWGDLNGYIVVNDEYIYVVDYFLNESPEESYKEALKVLDSFEFGL